MMMIDKGEDEADEEISKPVHEIGDDDPETSSSGRRIKDEV